MVWRIATAMADQAGVPPVEYEAVWAICLYLDERRTAGQDVTVERVSRPWQVVEITPDVSVEGRDGSTYRPPIVCIVDTESKVLAFRIAQEEQWEENVALAIYDALVSQRRPSREGAAGLTWQIPERLLTEVSLSPACRDACASIQIDVTPAPAGVPWPDFARSDWTHDLTGQPLRADQLARLFDNYLKKMHGYGPLSTQEDQDREFARLAGYNRDPAWQFPALRNFLPLRHRIIQDAAVECDGLHYTDELLALWPGQSVTLRRSEACEATAWVYLDGESVCQAMARELRRRDGSYRANRPGR
jgi:hypothetical protein